MSHLRYSGDVRDYSTLAELRSDLLRLVGEYSATHPREAQQSAFEPFYFTEAVEVTAPLELEARDLAEFRDGLQRLSHASLYYHFIAAQLRPDVAARLGEQGRQHVREQFLITGNLKRYLTLFPHCMK